MLRNLNLTTARLTLKPLAEADAPALCAAAQTLDLGNRQDISYIVQLQQPTNAAQFINTGQQTAALGVRYQLGVFQHGNAALVGNINIDAHAMLGLSLGYWCATTYQGHGYMTEVLNALTPHLLQQDTVQRVEAQISALNTPSRRLLEKLGFQYEGTRRNGAYIDGQTLDMHIYAHTPQSWDSYVKMQKAGLAGL